jgi:sulfotransferase family protein
MTPSVCSNPVFVIGAPRSATTAVAWSLDKHPELCNLGECQVLLDLFGDGELERNYLRTETPGGSFLAKNGVDHARFLAFVGLGLNALLTTCSGGLRWIDKTPGNALIASDVADLFPGALFLHMLRDGRQVVHSMLHFSALRSRTHLQGLTEPWMHDFRAACRTWREYVDAAFAFQATHPGRCLTIEHADVVEDPATGFARILAFLGASPHGGPAEHFRTCLLNSSFADDGTLPAERAWRSVDPWASWSVEERAIFREETGGPLAVTL